MRVGQTAALDEISASIGELKAYTHEHRHGVNNVSAKIDALGHGVGRRLERVEQKLGERIDAIERKLVEQIDSTERELGNRVATVDADVKSKFDTICKRIDLLEIDKIRRDGTRGMMSYLVDKWPSLTAAGGAVLMFLKMQGKL